MADLAAFLQETGQREFRYGETDCCLWVADWLVRNGHSDPAHDLRGTYGSAFGCGRVLKARGGLLAVFSDCMARTHCARTYEPKPGDVGVVEFGTTEGLGMIGAICTGPRWAMLSVRGLISSPASVLDAWSIG